MLELAQVARAVHPPHSAIAVQAAEEEPMQLVLAAMAVLVAVAVPAAPMAAMVAPMAAMVRIRNVDFRVEPGRGQLLVSSARQVVHCMLAAAAVQVMSVAMGAQVAVATVPKYRGLVMGQPIPVVVAVVT